MTNLDILDCLFIWLHPNQFIKYDTLPIGAEIGSRLLLDESIYEVTDIISYQRAIYEELIEDDEQYDDIKICFICKFISPIDFTQLDRHIKINSIL